MARQTLTDVEQRHRDIVKLEKDILLLHEMFQDFAIMIEEQVNEFYEIRIKNVWISFITNIIYKGEKIDIIEVNVIKVDEHAEVGKTELPEAVTNQRAARKVYKNKSLPSI